MDTKKLVVAAQAPQWVEAASESIQPVVKNAFNSGGKAGVNIKNFLHGTWLGHPLHPILTDIPIGAYTITAVLDMAELAGNRTYSKGADASLAIGVVGAVGAAITGAADWTATSGQKRRIGMVHAVLNTGATLLNLISLSLRSNKSSRGAAIGCSMVAYALTTAGAFLGGHLVYGEKMGTDHTKQMATNPTDFIDVIAESELPEATLTCAKANDIPVLLYKENGGIFAIANRCSHLGGPLNEGKLVAPDCVECPWHGSVFSIKTGEVVEGPATAPQTRFETKVQNGMVQVRLHTSEVLKRNEARENAS